MRKPERVNFAVLVRECAPYVRELFPWELLERLHQDDMLLLDVREPDEFAAMHIPGSLNVPRGILESACDYGYEETVPELVEARERGVAVICRSGNRSVLAAYVLGRMGFRAVWSLKTGLRGWHDYEQLLVDGDGSPVAEEEADRYFTPRLQPAQLGPHTG